MSTSYSVEISLHVKHLFRRFTESSHWLISRSWIFVCVKIYWIYSYNRDDGKIERVERLSTLNWNGIQRNRDPIHRREHTERKKKFRCHLKINFQICDDDHRQATTETKTSCLVSFQIHNEFNLISLFFPLLSFETKPKNNLTKANYLMQFY